MRSQSLRPSPTAARLSAGPIARLAGLALLSSSACSQLDAPGFDHLSAQRAALVTTGSSGGYSYRLFVPSSYVAGTPLPLVLMLHGCTQTAEQFAQATQIDALAESAGFLAAYPEQPTSANPVRCYRWFEPAHQARGAGEPAIMAGIVEHIGKRYTVDRERVYAAGFSAGAGLSVILGATYPDVFAAIAVGSGLEYKAAVSAGAAGTAMRSGGPNPRTQGDVAFRAMGPARRVVPTLVFHGSGDTTVAPQNAEQVLSQWAQTNDWADDGADNDSVDDRADRSETLTAPGGRRYTRSVYDDVSGAPLLEKVIVEGMGHAWSGAGTGGYTDARGPNQSALVWAFFRPRTRSGRSEPMDGGLRDAGAVDAATRDASTPDAATPDAATPDASTTDASTSDAGRHDAATVDAASDSGTPPRTLSLSSIDSEDGTVGALPVDGANASLLKVGDKGLFGGDTFRGVLSFDTSALPVGAALRSATLILVRKSQQGSVSAISLDVHNGALGRSAALEQSDYSATATLNGVVGAAPPNSDGTRLELSLPASALAAIRSGTRTQLRIRATTPRDFATDNLSFFDGAAGPQAPRLVLTY